MQLRRIPVFIAAPLARNPLRVARENAARAALEARQRRRQREDVEEYLHRKVPAQRRPH